jgi:uncharacterized protein YbjQ (UPF0145 family)
LNVVATNYSRAIYSLELKQHSKLDPKNPANNDPPACFTDTNGVIVSSMNDLPGYRIVRVLGTVYGLTVRSRNWGAGFGAIMKSVVGGEIQIFTKMMYSARNEAVERLVGEVLGRGGNAVIAFRWVTLNLEQFYVLICEIKTN